MCLILPPLCVLLERPCLTRLCIPRAQQSARHTQGKNNFVRSNCHSSCKDKYLKQKSDWKGNGKLSIRSLRYLWVIQVEMLVKKKKKENFKVRTVLQPYIPLQLNLLSSSDQGGSHSANKQQRCEYKYILSKAYALDHHAPYTPPLPHFPFVPHNSAVAFCRSTSSFLTVGGSDGLFQKSFI